MERDVQGYIYLPVTFFISYQQFELFIKYNIFSFKIFKHFVSKQ